MITMYLCLIFVIVFPATLVSSDTGNGWGPKGYVNVKFDCCQGITYSYQRHWYGSEDSQEPILLGTECYSVLLAPDTLKLTQILKMDSFVVQWSKEFWLFEDSWSLKGDSDYICTGQCDIFGYDRITEYKQFGKNESDVKASYGKKHIDQQPNFIATTLIMSRPRDTRLQSCKVEPLVISPSPYPYARNLIVINT